MNVHVLSNRFVGEVNFEAVKLMSRLIVSLNFEIGSKLLKVPQICLKCHCAPVSHSTFDPATDVKLNSIATNHIFLIMRMFLWL